MNYKIYNHDNFNRDSRPNRKDHTCYLRHYFLCARIDYGSFRTRIGHSFGIGTPHFRCEPGVQMDYHGLEQNDSATMFIRKIITPGFTAGIAIMIGTLILVGLNPE